MVLREDPSSIFSPDVEIENTLGPLSYDVSRVYTGTLEGKLVHAHLSHSRHNTNSLIGLSHTRNPYYTPFAFAMRKQSEFTVRFSSSMCVRCFDVVVFHTYFSDK